LEIRLLDRMAFHRQQSFLDLLANRTEITGRRRNENARGRVHETILMCRGKSQMCCKIPDNLTLPE
jgi:hypothetical protein